MYVYAKIHEWFKIVWNNKYAQRGEIIVSLMINKNIVDITNEKIIKIIEEDKYIVVNNPPSNTGISFVLPIFVISRAWKAREYEKNLMPCEKLEKSLIAK
jgi:hypothetical protein